MKLQLMKSWRSVHYRVETNTADDHSMDLRENQRIPQDKIAPKQQLLSIWICMNYNSFHHLIMHQKNEKNKKTKNRIRILKILQLTWACTSYFVPWVDHLQRSICKEEELIKLSMRKQTLMFHLHKHSRQHLICFCLIAQGWAVKANNIRGLETAVRECHVRLCTKEKVYLQ